jgi:hypothetical protein
MPYKRGLLIAVVWHKYACSVVFIPVFVKSVGKLNHCAADFFFPYSKEVYN